MNFKIDKSLWKLHFSVAMFGITGLFAKFVTLSAVMIVFGRCFFAALVLFLALKMLKSDFKFDNRKDLFVVIGTGVLIGVAWFCFFQSIKVSTVAVGLLGYTTIAIFTTFLEPIYFKTKIRFLDIILAVITFYGITLLVHKTPDAQGNTLLGIFFSLTAAFIGALFVIFSRGLVKNYSSIKVTFYQYSTVTIMGLFFFIPEAPKISINNLLLIIVLGIVFTAFANTLFIDCLKKITATKANIILTLEPVYGIILAAIILSETPSRRTIIGGAIILLCAVTATATHKKESLDSNILRQNTEENS